MEETLLKILQNVYSQSSEKDTLIMIDNVPEKEGMEEMAYIVNNMIPNVLNKEKKKEEKHFIKEYRSNNKEQIELQKP